MGGRTSKVDWWVGPWRSCFRYFPCSGTMNRSGVCHRYGVPPSGGPDRLKPGLQTGSSCKAAAEPDLELVPKVRNRALVGNFVERIGCIAGLSTKFSTKFPKS